MPNVLLSVESSENDSGSETPPRLYPGYSLDLDVMINWVGNCTETARPRAENYVPENRVPPGCRFLTAWTKAWTPVWGQTADQMTGYPGHYIPRSAARN